MSNCWKYLIILQFTIYINGIHVIVYKVISLLHEEQEIKLVSDRNLEKWKGGRGTLASWSSILVPRRPTLHLLSPSASHQKGIYGVRWLRAPSLASIIICASGVGQNWPCINKQKGRRTMNKQHIRDNQHCQNKTQILS